jgi:nucleoside-diphosphate-sugar epimerase/UDP-N-acetylglucosamine:LPS N-acetylglucosamine transferase
MGMKVVVTGGAGFIGSHVCAALRGMPGVTEVVVIDDLSTGRRSNVDRAACRLIVGSVLDSALLDRELRGADAVVHLAAVASVPRSLDDPVGCDLVNVSGTVRVLNAVRRTGSCLVILASSSAVYGNGAATVKHESTPVEPVTPYAVSKLAGEMYAELYARQFGVDVLALRLFNAYGPRQQADGRYPGVIPSFLRAALAGQPLTVHGDGRQTRDFVYVETIANVIAEAVRRRVTSAAPVNVGSGVPRSLMDIISELELLLGRRLEIEHVPRRLGDVLDSCAGIGRMRELFPSVEVKGLADGLSAMTAGWRTAPVRVGRPRRIAVTELMRRAASETVSRDRVVIVTASVASGHNGAARELDRRLVQRGLSVTRLDLLDLIPWVGAAMTATYVAMLRWAPCTYEFTYAALNRVRGLTAVANFVTRTGRRRLQRAIPPDTVLVVSTYPMASQLLGWLRRHQRLKVPAATFLTDFSVHRLWVAQGVETHLALHEAPAGQASRLGAAHVIVGGSLVGPAFRPLAPHERAEVRRQFGLPVGQRLALLVGGSWGVGDIGRAAREVTRTGQAVPVVVCGQNAVLRQRLQADGIQYCLGWVEQMPQLIGAVDVLVQNAGGLTSLESFAAGVPVLSYRNIPGHGRSNAAALHQAGLALSVERESDLSAALNELLDGPRGLRQRAAGLQLGELDPVDVIADVVRKPDLVPQQRRATRSRVGRRLAAVASVLAALIWTGTDGTRLAVAHGLNSVEPTHQRGLYIVVHPSADLDPQTITMMATLQVGAAIDAGLIQRQPDTVRRLFAGGVVLLNSGRGRPYHTGLISGRLAIRRTAEAIAHVDGHLPRLFVTGADLDAIDLGVVAAIHERIIVPDEWSSDGGVPDLRPGDVAMLECADDMSCQAELTQLKSRALRQGQPLRPISELIR